MNIFAIFGCLWGTAMRPPGRSWSAKDPPSAETKQATAVS
ncbi:unnamed protein product [Spirodela intermedia]|uniref:Uncharacterized protein n=1 Tax=Spirodela intermedia TaxID=51605 RepID=A0A7I8KNB8_SPIIN|nr:unnamed protein product [Spirodela intermedia]